MKKKKKKKTPFDLDAALGESSADTAENNDAAKPSEAGATDENFDLEYFGKIKKKKKKVFNLDDLENNLPSADADEKKDEAANEAAADEAANADNDYDLDLDFSKTKKKKKKKKEFVDLVADKSDEQQQNPSDSGM